MKVTNITSLFRLTGLVRREFAARLALEPWVAGSGIRPPTYGILSVVADREPVSQREVSDVIGLHPSDMVELVDTLESNGLVSRDRDPADRRRYHLMITPKGRKILGRFDEIAAAAEAAVLEPLTAKERRTLLDLVAKATEVVEGRS